MKVTKTKPQKFTADPGVYLATCISVEEGKGEAGPHFITEWMITFDPQAPDGEPGAYGKKIKYNYITFSEKNSRRVAAFIKALTGREYADEEEMEIQKDEILNKNAVIVVDEEVQKNKNGTVKTDDEGNPYYRNVIKSYYAEDQLDVVLEQVAQPIPA